MQNRAARTHSDESIKADYAGINAHDQFQKPAKVSKKEQKRMDKQEVRMKQINAQNPDNLKKMVLVSEKAHLRTSKLVLNKNALKFKQNVELEINMQ